MNLFIVPRVSLIIYMILKIWAHCIKYGILMKILWKSPDFKYVKKQTLYSTYPQTILLNTPLRAKFSIALTLTYGISWDS